MSTLAEVLAHQTREGELPATRATSGRQEALDLRWAGESVPALGGRTPGDAGSR